MIVGPLKSNFQLSVIILVVFCIAAWANTFAFLNNSTEIIHYNEHILYDYFFGGSLSSVLRQIVTLFAILGGALFLNFLAIEQEITSKNNYLPAFFYILFALAATSQSTVEPLLVANLFVLPSLYFLLNSYKQENAISEIFKAGVFMGLASFFCIHYIIVFPLMYFAILIFRPFNWREWVVLLIGLTIPLYFYIGTQYIIGKYPFAVFYMIKEATSSLQKPLFSEYYIGFIFVTVLAFIFAIVHYLGKGLGSKVRTQKAKTVLFWMLLFCFFMVFFEQKSDMLLLPCIIPLSIIIGDYISEIKQLKVANTLLTLFLGGFIVIYFHALGII